MNCLHPIPAFDCGVNRITGKRIIRFRSNTKAEADMFLPCGKCIYCLESRRREWVKRCQLELLECPQASFITLTFNDRFCPSQVSKRDLQLFFKRLRNCGRDFGFDASRIRYFACGEYGKKHHRPHYHAIVFGLDIINDPLWKCYPATVKGSYIIWSSPVLERYWPYGFCSVDTVTTANIKYVAKYVGKPDKDGCFLCSQGIGRGLFVSADRFGRKSVMVPKRLLRSTGFNDKISCEIGKPPSPLPRFALRYLDRFYPDLLERIKFMRHEYVSGRRNDYSLPSEREQSLRLKLRSEEKERIIDEYT